MFYVTYLGDRIPETRPAQHINRLLDQEYGHSYNQQTTWKQP